MYDPWNFGGAKSFIFRGLGGLAPSSPYVEPPLSPFQHPHSTVTLVISIQANLVTYVKQLVSCKWLSHNHKAPTACRYCSFEWSKCSSPCLVLIYISISILFQLEHPLAFFQHLNPFYQMSHCIHRCGCQWQDPPYQSSLQHSDLDALTVCATCVCNSDDLFATWPRLPFQFYAYTVTCISYFQAFQQPTVFLSFL